MTAQEKENLLTEVRVFYQYSHVLLPMIEKKKNVAIEELYAAHREGKQDQYIALVAKLSVYMEMEKEIINKAQAYKNVEEKLNATTARK